MTSSTVSRLSAPRSSTKDASGVTRSSSTPSWSTMIFFTRSATGSMKLLSKGRGPKVSLYLHVKAAIHTQHLSRHVGGGIGGEEGHRLRDVQGLPDAAQGDGRRARLPGLVGHGRGHVGFDEARRHGIHGDGARGDLSGHGLGEAQEAREVASRDRKSTRLNSSHSQTSYAVFCLKKKNVASTWSA